MDVWETIRIRCRRNGEKIKTVARELGISPNTLRRYLRKDSPPKRKPRRDVKSLTPYQSHIDNLILSAPKITAARIGSYLRQNVDADLVADERTLRRYVAGRRAVLIPREAFIRATYAPGDHYVEFRVMLSIADGAGRNPTPPAFSDSSASHNS